MATQDGCVVLAKVSNLAWLEGTDRRGTWKVWLPPDACMVLALLSVTSTSAPFSTTLLCTSVGTLTLGGDPVESASCNSSHFDLTTTDFEYCLFRCSPPKACCSVSITLTPVSPPDTLFFWLALDTRPAEDNGLVETVALRAIPPSWVDFQEASITMFRPFRSLDECGFC